MIKECTTDDDFRRILEDSRNKAIFVFKHSSDCPVSKGAWERFTAFAEQEKRPEYWRILVKEHKELSNRIAWETDIKHESPQVILFHDGRAVWKCGDRTITGDNLRRQLDRLGV